MSGFVYFEDVDDGVASTRSRADPIDAETGETLGQVSIPFELVQGEAQ